MSPVSPKRLGRRMVQAASGGVLVVLALLSLMFMRGPGVGQGSDDAREIDSQAVALSPTAEDEVSKETSSSVPGLTVEETEALSANTLIVLIDERQFLMKSPGDETGVWHPITLERLAEVATYAPGDSNGIRVRIEKRATARASAEQAIRQALEQAGIHTDAVFESSELVESGN